MSERRVFHLPGTRRVIAYWRYGSPDGPVIVNCHGGLSTGKDFAPFDALARKLGLTVISPDRPGIGGTSRDSGHNTLDWVRNDVRPLLTHLGVERFAAMGWSEGGQYALALGSEFPDRVTRVAVIAGALPLSGPATFNQLGPEDRLLLKLSRHAPLLCASYFACVHHIVRWAPKTLLISVDRDLSPSDAAIFRKRVGWFAELAVDATRSPAGATDGYRSFGEPWGFKPERISVPVDLYQGERDQVISPAWAERLAARIPGARLHRYPGEGHFIALTHRADVLRALAVDFR